MPRARCVAQISSATCAHVLGGLLRGVLARDSTDGIFLAIARARRRTGVIITSGNGKVTTSSLPRVFRQVCRYSRSHSTGKGKLNLSVTGRLIDVRGKAVATTDIPKGKAAFVVVLPGTL